MVVWRFVKFPCTQRKGVFKINSLMCVTSSRAKPSSVSPRLVIVQTDFYCIHNRVLRYIRIRGRDLNFSLFYFIFFLVCLVLLPPQDYSNAFCVLLLTECRYMYDCTICICDIVLVCGVCVIQILLETVETHTLEANFCEYLSIFKSAHTHTHTPSQANTLPKKCLFDIIVFLLLSSVMGIFFEHVDEIPITLRWRKRWHSAVCEISTMIRCNQRHRKWKDRKVTFRLYGRCIWSYVRTYNNFAYLIAHSLLVLFYFFIFGCFLLLLLLLPLH